MSHSLLLLVWGEGMLQWWRWFLRWADHVECIQPPTDSSQPNPTKPNWTPHSPRYVTYRGMKGDIEPPEFKVGKKQ